MKIIEVKGSDKLATLSGNSYFDELPAPLLKNIADHTQLREYERGDVLFWEATLALVCISSKQVV